MRPLLRFIAGTAVAGTATIAYASLVERHRYALRHTVVPVSGTPAGPLRILHLSDLHMMPGQHGKIRWIERLAAEEPDLVIVTGDNLASVDAVPATLRALGPLLERPGAFVFGSNDYRGPVLKNPLGYFAKNREYVQGTVLPTAELRDALTGAGWMDCNNTRVTVKAGYRVIDLVGVDDPHIGRDSYPPARPEPRQPDPGPPDIRIGLLHTPEPRVLDAMAADGCSLILAGHTHGGQVRIPLYGALVTNCGLDRRLAKGLHRWRDSATYLHVSAGLGTHPTAPFRFACPPEASMLTLVTQ
ncbi:MAG: metallophosphoesterase [Dactylosporangium sp.]|nr:metallophosphoesterase [Dactylosporangium sp.]NNJ63259.1 metallophosphoesterase [Dactylosporangium sp.]